MANGNVSEITINGQVNPCSKTYFLFLKSIKRWPTVNSTCGTRDRALMINTIFGYTKSSTLMAPMFFHAVWMMDMVINRIPSAKGPILALTCFVLASKYEEESFIDKTQIESVLELSKLWKAEKRIWRTLDFNLTCPNLMFILRYISWEGDDGDSLTRSIAKLLLYCCVYHKHYLRFTPVQLCAAALFIAKSIQDQTPEHVLKVAEVSLVDILPAAQLIKTTLIDIEPMNICGPLFSTMMCGDVCLVELVKTRLPNVKGIQ